MFKKLGLSLLVIGLLGSNLSAWDMAEPVHPVEVDEQIIDPLADRVIEISFSVRTVINADSKALGLGGAKTVKEASSDGVGVIFISNPTDQKFIDNSIYNKLVFKYAEAASKEGLSLRDFISYSENPIITQADKDLAYNKSFVIHSFK